MGVNKKAQPMLLVVPEEEEDGGSKGTVSTFLQSRIHESFTRAADQLYAMGLLTTEERIAISGCIGDALEAFVNIAQEKVPSASDIEVPLEVAQEILRNAILHVRQGQDEELGKPISSDYLDLPDRTQDHSTLRDLIDSALMDERSAISAYDTLLDVVYQMDLTLDPDLPTREAFEEILNDERDHEKILLRMLGEPVPEPGLASAGRHSFDKCMECSKPPEYEVMWFDGRAHAWFCEAHLEKWLDEDRDRRNGSDIPWIKETIEGKAFKNPTENTNPNIMNRFVKKSSLPETEAEFFEELVRVSKRIGQLDMPRTLAVDLDGTILEYDGFKGVGVFGNPINGARETLQKFKEDGWFIVIDTCRGEVPLVIEHLMLFDIPFDSVNNHPFQPSTANPGKPIAEYRIDDTSIHFDGDWTSIYNEVGRREQLRSLRAMRIAWRPPIEKKIALQELADDLSDEEWLEILPHTTEIAGDSVVLSRKVSTDTYRMIRCGGEYSAFRNFDPVYRSGGLFNEQELLESFEAAINSEDPATVKSVLNGYESCLLSTYRSHGFNNPEQWISITGTVIDGDHRVIYVEADPRSFVKYNEVPMGDPQSLLVLLERVADGAYAYDPLKHILFDFLDPFGNRAQPTDYPDPARWGEPEELKKRVLKRRLRDKEERIEQPDNKMKTKMLLDTFVKERLQ